MQQYSNEDVIVEERPTGADSGSPPPFSPPIPFQFSGTPGEYFRIWVVNLLLSVITLGLYSPWAKVRRLRYFYGSTSVNGASFTYHASPVAILRGRLVTYGVLITAFAIGYFSPDAGQVLYILLGLCWPAVMVKALRFRNRNSGYRGIRFDFDGDYREAYRVYLWLGALMVPTLGLIYPYVLNEQQKFVVGNTRYGTSPFRIELTTGPFIQIFVRGVALLIGLIIVAGVFYFVAVMAIAGMGLDLGSPDDPDAIAAGAALLSILMLILLFAVFGVVYVYFQTAVRNLVLNNVALVDRDVADDDYWRRAGVEELARFASTLSTPRLLWIYLTNWAAIVLSAGLAVPWARIRLAHYRAQCLYLFYRPALERVVSGEADAIAATGSEFAEAVDFDIGL